MHGLGIKENWAWKSSGGVYIVTVMLSIGVDVWPCSLRDLILSERDRERCTPERRGELPFLHASYQTSKVLRGSSVLLCSMKGGSTAAY